MDNKPKDKSVMSQIKHELKCVPDVMFSLLCAGPSPRFNPLCPHFKIKRTGTATGVLGASSSYARKAIRPNAEARFKQEQKDAERKNGTFGRQSSSAPASASAQQLLGYAQGTTPKLATGCRVRCCRWLYAEQAYRDATFATLDDRGYQTLRIFHGHNLQAFFIHILISKHQPGEVITLDFRKENEKLLEKTKKDYAAKAWKKSQQGAADGTRAMQTPRLPPPPVSNFASIRGKSTL